MHWLPENVEGLLPVWINELLYQCLPSRFHFPDQKLRGQNTFFTRGLGPLISLLDRILKIQVALRNCRNDEVRKTGDNIQIGDDVLDLTEVHSWLDSSVRLLCAENGTTLQRRKHQLCSFLAPQYHYLLKPTNVVTTELLGPGY